MPTRDWFALAPEVDFDSAAARLEGVLPRTPLQPFDTGDPRIELRLKLENRQTTGAFKARGAWNQISQLAPGARAVACSSGNHGRALAWAAQRAGVPATIVMPKDAYPNKIEACRAHAAEVVLCDTREEAEEEAARRVADGWTLVHPYDALRTIEGAGTVGREIAVEWPEVEVVVVPVGGGGLAAGTSLALRRARAEGSPVLHVFAVEPEGAPTLTLGLAAGHPVPVGKITTRVQGLCPLDAGRLNVAICLETIDRVFCLDDDVIHAAQARLVRAGETVEPAGAAAPALVFEGRLPVELLQGRDPGNPLRVAAVVSGGTPDPAQLEALRGHA